VETKKKASLFSWAFYIFLGIPSGRELWSFM